LEKCRLEVELIIGRGQKTVNQEMTFTPRAKNVMERAFEYMNRKKLNYLDEMALLYGLLKDTEGMVARVLSNVGVDREELLSGLWSLTTFKWN